MVRQDIENFSIIDDYDEEYKIDVYKTKENLQYILDYID